MLGRAAFLERTIRKLNERRRTRPLTAAELDREAEAREALSSWCAWQVSGRMGLGILWRPKRDGGPYRLDLGQMTGVHNFAPPID